MILVGILYFLGNTIQSPRIEAESVYRMMLVVVMTKMRSKCLSIKRLKNMLCMLEFTDGCGKPVVNRLGQKSIHSCPRGSYLILLIELSDILTIECVHRGATPLLEMENCISQ